MYTYFDTFSLLRGVGVVGFWVMKLILSKKRETPLRLIGSHDHPLATNRRIALELKFTVKVPRGRGFWRMAEKNQKYSDGASN